MSAKNDTSKTFDPFEPWRTLRDAGMEAWARHMAQAVNSEPYLKATGAMLDAYLSASAPVREAFAANMAMALQQFNLPSRAEVIGIAERLTNIEMRLDDLDAKLDAALRRGRTGEGAPASSRREAKGE